MKYSIGEIAKKMDLSVSALRYYDKEGLFPNLGRTQSGIREFAEADLEALKIIECLKKTNMPIKDIKQFIDWCGQGDETLKQRHAMFLERKKIMEEELVSLQETLKIIEYKCWYYSNAVSAQTENTRSTARGNS